MPITLSQLRRYALARSLFTPTTLEAAIARMGFVQADPIRAPARAQDLTLRHRVRGYAAGDLERRYAQLPVEEDYFVNYGFLPRSVQALMHPRHARQAWPSARMAQARAVWQFISERGSAHPREVEAQFAHGKTVNGFGGTSNASTQLLDGMHYRGWLRVLRREGGTRVYAAQPWRTSTVPRAVAATRLDQLLDVIVGAYAPLPAPTLAQLVSQLRGGVPQWSDLRGAALTRGKQRWGSAHVDGVDWYWPVGEDPAAVRRREAGRVRLLAPFDPVVWDRRRFEAFWGWAYRFEAYTPAARRTLGYYALPMLWGDQIIGWGNLRVQDGQVHSQFGYVAGKAPEAAAFAPALAKELQRMATFLGLPTDVEGVPGG